MADLVDPCRKIWVFGVPVECLRVASRSVQGAAEGQLRQVEWPVEGAVDYQFVESAGEPKGPARFMRDDLRGLFVFWTADFADPNGNTIQHAAHPRFQMFSLPIVQGCQGLRIFQRVDVFADQLRILEEAAIVENQDRHPARGVVVEYWCIQGARHGGDDFDPIFKPFLDYQRADDPAVGRSQCGEQPHWPI